MNFTGNGTINFDNKMGSLEYVTQEILKTQDTAVYSEVHSFKGSFDDVRQTISDWGKSAMTYYTQSDRTQSKIQSDLNKLTGAVGDLTNSIDTQTDRLLVPATRIENQLVVISKTVPAMYTSMEATRTSIQGLYDVVSDISTRLNNLGSMGQYRAPEVVSPVIGDIPDYSSALDDISDIIGSIRDSINGLDFSFDASTIYPGLRSELGKIKDVISELATSYNTSEGFDVNGFTSAVEDVISGFANDLADSFIKEFIPELADTYTDFVTSFTVAVREEFNKSNNALVTALSTRPASTGLQTVSFENGALVEVAGGFATNTLEYLDKITDIQLNFSDKTIEGLTNIDERLAGGLVTLDNTVRRSGSKGTRKDMGDVINSFDNLKDSSEKSGGFVEKIFDFLESNITEYLQTIVGLFTFANIKESLDTIHADTKMILQATGGKKSQALELRDAINDNIAGTFGMATFSSEEREQALNDAIRSGAVSQRHLEQATEVSLAYNKLLGTTIDFSQGWAKSLLVTKTNADDYLEAVAVSIDDFSNKFFVSADTLQKAAENYADTARIFTTDMKSFSKAINSAIQLQAAQEAANINSLKADEFADYLNNTPMAQWGQAAYMRLNNAGMTLPEAENLAFFNPSEFGARLYEGHAKYSKMLQDEAKKGGYHLDAAKWRAQYMDVKFTTYAAESEQFDKAAKIAREKDVTRAGDISSLKERAETVANNNMFEQLTNIASALRDDKDSIPGKILSKLEEMGVSGGFAGILSGIGSMIISGLLTKGIGRLLGGLIGKGGFLGKIGSLFGDAVTSSAPEIASGVSEGVTGGLLKGGIGKALGGLLSWTPAATGPMTMGAGGVMSAGLGVTLGAGLLGGGMFLGDAFKAANDWSKDDSILEKLKNGLIGGIFGTGKGIGQGDAGEVALSAGGNALKGAGIGAAIGSIIPGLGTAIGAAVGGGIGLIGGLIGGQRVAGVEDSDVTNGDSTPKAEEMPNHSDVTHTGEHAFTDTGTGRKGSANAAGLNRYAYSDYGAAALLDKNTPIEHEVGEEKTAVDFGITDEPLAGNIGEKDIAVASAQEVSDTGVNSLEGGKEQFIDLTLPDSEADSGVDSLAGGKEQFIDLTLPDSEAESGLEEEKPVDITTAVTESTDAIKELTTVLRQAYGIYEEIPEAIDSLEGDVTSEATPEVVSAEEQSGTFLDALTGGITGLLSSGIFGPVGQLASGALLALTEEEKKAIADSNKNASDITVKDTNKVVSGASGFLLEGQNLKNISINADDAEKIKKEFGLENFDPTRIGLLTELGKGLFGFPGGVFGALSNMLSFFNGDTDIAGTLGLSDQLDTIDEKIGFNPVGTAPLSMPSDIYKGPIINPDAVTGSEGIAAPIVDSIDTNMASVIGLLERIANGSTQKSNSKAFNYPSIPTTPPIDTTGDNTLTSYHAINTVSQG